MAKVLNQNDIVNIVKQQTHNTNEIVNIVYNNSAKGLKEITSSKMKVIKKYSDFVGDVIKNIFTLKRNKIKDDELINKKSIKSLQKSHEELMKLIYEVSYNSEYINKRIGGDFQLYKIVEDIIKQLKMISHNLKLVNPIKIKFKTHIIKISMRYICDLINYTTHQLQGGIDVIKSDKFIRRYVSGIFNIINIFNKYELRGVIYVWWKIRRIKKLLNKIKSLIEHVEEFEGNILKLANSNINTGLIEKLINDIKLICEYIQSVKLKLLFTIPIKIFVIKQVFNSISKLIKYIDKKSINPIAVVKGLISFEILEKLIYRINILINALKTIKLKHIFSVFYRILILRGVIKSINKLIVNINKLSILSISSAAKVFIGTKILSIILDNIFYIINTLRGMKISLIQIFFINIKIKRIIRVLKSIRLMIYEVSKLGVNVQKMASSFANIVILVLNIKVLDILFDAIREVKTWRIIKKLKNIIRGVKYIRRLVNILNRIRVKKSIIFKLKDLIFIFLQLSLIFLNIIIISPIAILFSIAIWAVVLAVWVLAKSVQIILSIARGLLKVKALLGFLALMAILGATLLLATMMLIIAEMSKTVAKNFVNIIILIGSIVAVVVMMGLLGGLMGMLLPLMPVILLGMAFVGIILISTLALAGMLYLISSLMIDKDKLQYNINTIFDSIQMIISAIFGYNDKESSESKKGFFGKLFGAVGGFIGQIANVLLAIPFMAVAMGAIIMVTIMAMQLQVISNIKINTNKLKDNISSIFDSLNIVIDSVFRKDDKETDGTKKGFFGKLFDVIGGPIKQLAGILLSLPYMALSFGAISMIMFLGKELQWISNYKIDSNKLKTNISSIFDSLNIVINSVFGKDDKEANGTKKGFFGKLFDVIGGPIKQIAGVLLSLPYMALAFGAISMITFISKELQWISNMKIDNNKINNNVTSVFDALNIIISKIFQPDTTNNESSKRGFFGKLFDVVGGPIKQIAGVLLSIPFLALSIGAISLVNILAKQLKKISDIKLDDISGKIDTIIGSAQLVINKIMTGGSDGLQPEESKKSWIGRAFEKLCPTLSGIVDIISASALISSSMLAIGMVGQMAEQLSIISKIDFKEKTIQNSLDVILGCGQMIVNKLSNEEFNGKIKKLKSNRFIDYIKDINKEISKFAKISDKDVENTEKTLNSYGKFIEKINTVKVENLEKSTAMFQQMARFSESIEGNFEKLADALNEKIMPLLQEMKEISGQVPTKLDQGFANTSATMAATAAGPMNQSTMTAQVQRENPNMSKKDIEKMVDNRMKDQAKNQAQSLTAKIDEVIELLQGSGKIKVIPV